MADETGKANVTCAVHVPGWRLHLALMERTAWRDLGNVMDMATEGVHAELRRSFPGGDPAAGETARLVREAVSQLGLDPDAQPLGSEQLLAECLAKETFPRGSLAWEFLAVLTIKSQAPWTAVDGDAIEGTLEYRIGRNGESLLAMNGAFDCEGLPVLADANRVVASPWTTIDRYALEGCRRPLFICFLPRDVFRAVQPKTHMGRAVWLTWAYRFVIERTCSYAGDT